MLTALRPRELTRNLNGAMRGLRTDSVAGKKLKELIILRCRLFQSRRSGGDAR
jgi:hypothetical protein